MYNHFSRNYYFERHPGASSGLVLVGCGHEDCEPSYRVERRECPFYALEYVIRGQGWFVCYDRRVKVGPGMFFSYGPGLAHAYWADRSDPWEKLWIGFRGTEAASHLKTIMGATGGTISVPYHERIHLLLTDCVSEAAGGQAHAQEIATNYLQIILLKLQEARTKESSDGTGSKALYLECRRHIDENFSKMKSSFELLSLYNISTSYLCRLFKRFAGRSPHDFVMSLKMNRAAHLLVTTALSVKEIAAQLLFEDPLHFSRVFRKYYGRSPRHYRIGSSGRS